MSLEKLNNKNQVAMITHPTNLKVVWNLEVQAFG